MGHSSGEKQHGSIIQSGQIRGWNKGNTAARGLCDLALVRSVVSLLRQPTLIIVPGQLLRNWLSCGRYNALVTWIKHQQITQLVLGDCWSFWTVINETTIQLTIVQYNHREASLESSTITFRYTCYQIHQLIQASYQPFVFLDSWSMNHLLTLVTCHAHCAYIEPLSFIIVDCSWHKLRIYSVCIYHIYPAENYHGASQLTVPIGNCPIWEDWLLGGKVLCNEVHWVANHDR